MRYACTPAPPPAASAAGAAARPARAAAPKRRSGAGCCVAHGAWRELTGGGPRAGARFGQQRHRRGLLGAQRRSPQQHGARGGAHDAAPFGAVRVARGHCERRHARAHARAAAQRRLARPPRSSAAPPGAAAEGAGGCGYGHAARCAAAGGAAAAAAARARPRCSRTARQQRLQRHPRLGAILVPRFSGLPGSGAGSQRGQIGFVILCACGPRGGLGLTRRATLLVVATGVAAGAAPQGAAGAPPRCAFRALAQRRCLPIAALCRTAQSPRGAAVPGAHAGAHLLVRGGWLRVHRLAVGRQARKVRVRGRRLCAQELRKQQTLSLGRLQAVLPVVKHVLCM